MKKSKNKLMAVTGASAGIGYEISKIHAKNGGHLVIIARREEKLSKHKQAFESQFGVRVHVLAMDVTQHGTEQRFVQYLKEKNLTLDYFVNNAGFGGLGPFVDRRVDDDLAIVDLNIVAFTRWLHTILNVMKNQGHGRVLNVGSTAGIIPGGPNQATYCASKAYVNSLSRATSHEMQHHGVSVCLLCPGATETEFAKVAKTQNTKVFQTPASAYKVAKDGYKAMLNGEIEVISGLTPFQKMMFSLMPVLPLKTVLKEVEKGQSE